jgi:hypothetical protein
MEYGVAHLFFAAIACNIRQRKPRQQTAGAYGQAILII